MDKQLIPNSTQIPNILLDFVLPELPEGEMRCLLYICRRTYGFHKEYDRISFSQFIEGLEGKDKGCGLTRAALWESLRNLEGAGAIVIRKYKSGNIYKINLDMNPSKVVQKVNHLRWFRKQTKSGSESEPRVVQKLNLQNKGNIGNKEEIKKNDETESSRKKQMLGIYKTLKAKGMIKKLNPEYEAIIAGEK